MNEFRRGTPEKVPNPASEEVGAEQDLPEKEELEKAQFRMATMAADAIRNFCEQESGSINRFDERAFRDFVEAYSSDGAFQWTPSVPGFKRVATTPPNYWRDRELFAIVIQNRLDTADPALTDKLNSMIRENIAGIEWKKETEPVDQEAADNFKRMLQAGMGDTDS